MKNDLDIFGAIKSTGIEALKDYGDKGLSEFVELFDKELLADIPYVSTIINIASLGTRIKQYFFAKKLVKFLTQLENIPLKERRELVAKLENSDESKKIGDKLIVLIDSLDDDEKAVILGKLFKKTIEGKLDLSDFHRLSIGINKIYLADLYMFIEWQSQSFYELHEDIQSSLYSNGFLSIKIGDAKKDNSEAWTMMGIQNTIQPALEYKVSELGKLFLNNID